MTGISWDSHSRLYSAGLAIIACCFITWGIKTKHHVWIIRKCFHTWSTNQRSLLLKWEQMWAPSSCFFSHGIWTWAPSQQEGGFQKPWVLAYRSQQHRHSTGRDNIRMTKHPFYTFKMIIFFHVHPAPAFWQKIDLHTLPETHALFGGCPSTSQRCTFLPWVALSTLSPRFQIPKGKSLWCQVKASQS